MFNGGCDGQFPVAGACLEHGFFDVGSCLRRSAALSRMRCQLCMIWSIVGVYCKIHLLCHVGCASNFCMSCVLFNLLRW